MERLGACCQFGQRPPAPERIFDSSPASISSSVSTGRARLHLAEKEWRNLQSLSFSRHFPSQAIIWKARTRAAAISHQPVVEGFTIRGLANFASATERSSGLEEQEEEEEEKEENSSARERRKLRNERREQRVASQGQSWREVAEERMVEKEKRRKKNIKLWKEPADLDLCIAKGVRWWMLQTAKRREAEVVEEIRLIFEQDFPGREYEVLVPTVPVRAKLKDGEVSQARKKLYEGIVLIRCILDRELDLKLTRIRRAYNFFGTFAGSSIQPIVMPAPIANITMENMFEIVKKEEEEYERFKEKCRIENEELRRDIQKAEREKEQAGQQQERLRSKRLVLEVGASIRVLSGPFVEFTGKVAELLPEQNQIRAVITVFGNETKMLLDVKDVVVEAAGP